MVSGFVTSPKLQERIFSGDAIEILMALKSRLGCCDERSKLLKGCKGRFLP
jgi:hypothetical protein